jgi:citrate synthase
MAVTLAAAADPLRGDLRPPAVARSGEELISSMAAAVGGTGARVPRPVLREPGSLLAGTVAGRLLAGLSARRPRAGLLPVLNASLVLLADHELAVSTLAARIAASARADP